MSRVAKYPVKVPAGVEVKIDGATLTAKGGQGTLSMPVHDDVVVAQEDGQLTFQPSKSAKSWAMVGTTRALVQNLVTGVSEGFTKSLEIIGVGYRAQAKGQTLNLTLGFSHPVDYQLPEGVTAETPKNTVIVLKSADKQKLGQVAAEIRAFRPPEPYKGKGVRYADEQVRRKEAKKK
ncbi:MULTISPECIES: 50S ribosomal protein L6 [Halomonas]|jgi:large subunit ribosomal protein L6|uniref:Large ribosomal subunit protein uL6 n=2 Tax=Halomonas TaxID=2745 RepID=A0AAU7KGA3_9GAMM|nr:MULTISPECIES: 50S ribosomal protein L6 [Halomonas]KJZ18768.1 50S ribosomal protein L6 [Halomonas sp. S2151]MAR72906.1 50S ribosomal protein L6 [Halomonas sp.]MBS8270267.1 50S ribosomal protein L6 [Halomonas litopenaei]MBY5942620.1 50S ribosomal protein L6 [Halomonas sp. DP5N14-9]MBY6112541.1 50S ribosomal protein L6 [Halomonas sp. DP1Y21-3]|tara:strand:- start:2778 stop:3308 length:531 start_codon:yes stop_codon:yes gene_type:complete